jgi:stage V sporulation protein R
MNLPPELEEWKKHIADIAIGYGLDFYKTIFEMVDHNIMSTLAAYGGFPNRYPHWSFGMSYEELSKGYEYGLSKIYEMVINTDPCIAYLMVNNPLVDHKLVIAHVYGHCDFFKNNRWFGQTNRKMMDQMANNGSKIRAYSKKYGFETVEKFIDACLSIDNLIDYHSPFVRRHESLVQQNQNQHAQIKMRTQNTGRYSDKEYMETFLHPPSVDNRTQDESSVVTAPKFPEHPESDVMLFLLQHAPLEKWQENVLEIIREESYYFAPQGMTKIMNEGWASFWHTTIMRDVMDASEVIDFADHHSGTVAVHPGQLNPYKLGLELLRDIEYRWNTGRFGKEYEECDHMETRANWNKELGLGRKKIFEVRQTHNDITFIDTFLTKEFVEQQKMFTYMFNPHQEAYVITDRDFQKIKQTLLFNLTNFGQPIIYVENGNYENRGELLLIHKYEGIPLRTDYAQHTLKNLNFLWKRPVNIETYREDKKITWRYDGEEFKESSSDA